MRRNAVLVLPALGLALAALVATARPAPAAPKAYRVEEVKNGGTIRGMCRIDAAPALDPLSIFKDNKEDACGVSATRPSERVIVGEDRGLANCVVYLKEIASGKDWPEAMRSEDRKSLINQKGCKYAPHIMWVRPETQIAVGSEDNAEHNIHAYRESMADTQFNFTSAPFKSNDDTEAAFLKKTGKYIVKCDIHPWMSAYIFVAPNPYHDITAAPAAEGRKCGEYVLENVPEGTYTLVFWHEGMIERPTFQDAQIKAYTYSVDLQEEQADVKVEAGKTVTVDHEFKAQAK